MATMQYTISVNQKAIVERWFDIDLLDAAILCYMKDVFSVGKNQRIVDESNVWFRVEYSDIKDEMPILWIKNTEVISRRVSNLIRNRLIARKITKTWWTKTFFRLGERYEELVFDHPTQKSSDTGKDEKAPDSKVETHPTQKSSHIGSSIPLQYTEDTSLRSVSLVADAPQKEESRTKRFLDSIQRFTDEGNLDSPEFEEICRAVSEKLNVDYELTFRELPKFGNYWTQMNENGRKQKWEKEKAFELVKRLRTWFSNATERSNYLGNSRKKWTVW